MKHYKSTYLIFLLSAYAAASCSGPSSDKYTKTNETAVAATPATPMTLEEAEKGWKTNKGIGPIESIDIPAEVDQTLAAKGQAVYEAKCTACHKPLKQFIGPAPLGVLERRTPEWVMNMILNPEGMVAKDPIARQLLMKFNAPMANQNLTQEEARAVVEYFRTLK